MRFAFPSGISDPITVTAIPEALVLNGTTTIPRSPNVAIMSNSYAGCVYRLNINIGEDSVVISDPAFLPLNTSASTLNPGINGLHVRGRVLTLPIQLKVYYGRVPTTADSYTADEMEIICHELPEGHGYDEFALEKKGSAWLTTHSNTINLVSASGGQNITAGVGNRTGLVELIYAAFGRGSFDQERTL